MDVKDKPQLLLTCKALRKAVLQQAVRLKLNVGQLGSDGSYSEAKEVLSRQHDFDTFTLLLPTATLQQTQRLLSEVAADAAKSGHVCGVTSLGVVGRDCYDESKGTALLGPAFPGAKSLLLLKLRLDPSTLEGLAHCKQLGEMCVMGCCVVAAVTPPQLRSWLPAVNRLSLSGDADIWLAALAPQLTMFNVARTQADRQAEDEDDDWCGPADILREGEAYESLSQAAQLVDISLHVVYNATVKALLKLPSLKDVACENWEAWAGNKKCTWSHFRIFSFGLSDYRPDALPRGIHTMYLKELVFCIESNWAGEAQQAAQVLSETTVDACQELVWVGKQPRVVLLLDCPSPGVMSTNIAAALGGMTALRKHLPTLKLKIVAPPLTLDSMWVHLLSEVTDILQVLSVQCACVHPKMWGALSETLPHLKRIKVVMTAPDDMLIALGAIALNKLCRSSGSALTQVKLVIVTGRRRQGQGQESPMAVQMLKSLQHDLEAGGAPVKLLVSSAAC